MAGIISDSLVFFRDRYKVFNVVHFYRSYGDKLQILPFPAQPVWEMVSGKSNIFSLDNLHYHRYRCNDWFSPVPVQSLKRFGIDGMMCTKVFDLINHLRVLP